MTREGPLPLPPEDSRELEAFCAPGADRYAILSSSLRRRGIRADTLAIAGARHVIVPAPASDTLDREYYRVTIVAHYDRVPGTPGANDNAAAVFQLLAHLEDIGRLGWRHRTQALFTDKEEILGDAPATSQGSWALARELKKRRVDNVLFFVLDMCGIGDVPVWGRSVRKAGLVPRNKAYSRAYGVMESFLKRFTHGADFGVNPLFSDDLGLLLGGYPALQVSLLPRSEAEGMTRAFPASGETDPSSPARARDLMRGSLPPSWRNNHGPDDGIGTLQPGSFLLMSRLLRDLARYRFPLPS
jgi:hypothetical protein